VFNEVIATQAIVMPTQTLSASCCATATGAPVAAQPLSNGHAPNGSATVNGASTAGTVGESPKQYMEPLAPLGLRVLGWHFANIEYASGAELQKLSLRYW
jgi:hypothetical protein